jgi:DNA-binding NarL/FixJ family response regulator
MRVVLADDHRLVRSGIRWVLENEEGLEIVGEAGDGAALLELLGAIPTDVVLLDVRMPGLGGLDVLPLISERHPSVRVVILSMHDEPAFIRAAIERGAAGYLLKSAGTDELRAALNAVVAGKSYVQPELAEHVFAQLTGSAAEPPSQRGLAVLRLVADGLSTMDIASELGVSEAAVKTSLQQTFDRLGVSSRAEAVALALRRGLID